MRTGSVTLCRLSSSNSTVGWLRLVVSAQIQITLCKYYVMASESFRITNLPPQTKTVSTGGRKYKPRQFFSNVTKTQKLIRALEKSCGPLRIFGRRHVMKGEVPKVPLDHLLIKCCGKHARLSSKQLELQPIQIK